MIIKHYTYYNQPDHQYLCIIISFIISNHQDLNLSQEQAGLLDLSLALQSHRARLCDKVRAIPQRFRFQFRKVFFYTISSFDSSRIPGSGSLALIAAGHRSAQCRLSLNLAYNDEHTPPGSFPPPVFSLSQSSTKSLPQ